MNRIFLYPFWLRLWHWFNAFLFLILIISGLSLHYSDPNSALIAFNIAMISHNVAGIFLSLSYIFFVIQSIFKGNYKQYIPRLRGFIKRITIQSRFYLFGIFIGESHPYETSAENKFNPLQQITYLTIMIIFMPVICISGILLMFPEVAPDSLFGMGGVWPMAFTHTITGYVLSLFMIVHIYLGTTGNTIGELFKSMISGWHLHHEKTPEELSRAAEEEARTKIKRRLLPVVFYNPVSLTGTLVAVISFFMILFLMVMEFFAASPNPYLGIITFVVLPTGLLLGLFLIAFGAIKENRRLLMSEFKIKRLPVIDLNNPKHQVATILFSVITILLVVFSIFGSFKAYEYTDSDEFCGKVCHKVMEPEYSAYLKSPHSRVGCVKCHIGPGTDWFVRSKLSGTYQVYSVLFNKYSQPIPTPVSNLRPAQETCEQCHWPKHFYSEKKRNFDFFTSDEHNSEYKVTMMFKVGGGSEEFGNSSGIHWIMNIANEISYIHLDNERNIIPWVKAKNYMTGKETIYRDTSYKLTSDNFKPENIRKMDCIDCHNRPSHIFYQPNRTLNSYLSVGYIDRTLPYIKNIAVQALETYTHSRENSMKEISSFILGFYKKNYPTVYMEKKNIIDNNIKLINTIYKNNYFPEMKADWKNFPNNIGHMYSPGCFRCHDGKHVTDDGKVITIDCSACHKIVFQQPADQPSQESNNGLDFVHPGGVDKITDTKICTQCHGSYPKKKNEQDVTGK